MPVVSNTVNWYKLLQDTSVYVQTLKIGTTIKTAHLTHRYFFQFQSLNKQAKMYIQGFAST
jgi:hypothetical protein